MATLFVRHTVADCATWRRIFDGFAPTQEALGVTGKAVYALWGITAISGPALHQTLAGQLVGGKALVDVKIKVRSRLSDVLVTVVTLGIIVPRTVTAEGVVVK